MAARIELATILPGSKPFTFNGNINLTYTSTLLLSDGRKIPAIVKDITLKELANEALSSIIARELGLPVPTSFLALADSPSVLAGSNVRLGNGASLFFASERKGNLSYSPEIGQ